MTEIDIIKRKATKLKREKGIKHSEALELVSKEHGYNNYKHALNSLK